MKTPRLPDGLRSVLHHLKMGLIWSGAMWAGVPTGFVTMHMDEPLTAAERAEWAALEQRLR
ncbi:hypothetical protein ACQP26_19070 [Micromonospora sp. CA-248089]|uniref:hypothetical protein n=1 Tax=unclassified Micromonospora TaxID=2617518 RepID=UPI00248AA6F5|nr:hypothetical protein [Micromonospora sp. WMMA1947]WBC07586.1 hypothetical protein O7604_20475 [Micromonospora sp. WMMA1947]